METSQAPHPEQAPVILDIPSGLSTPLAISALICSLVVPLQQQITSFFLSGLTSFTIAVNILRPSHSNLTQAQLVQLHVDDFKCRQYRGKHLIGMHGTGFTQLITAIPGNNTLG